ncbi:MAG: hypothetical protein IPN29_04320 [Saprospiraceae bacterium]|nr:hypothetical protein [Saprospiraceae bacterium]
MKKSIGLFAFALLFSLFSCGEEERISMTYRMTQCAEPWMEEGWYFDAKEVTLKSFLEKRGMEIFDLRITTDCLDINTCAACTCIGCDVADVKIDADDEESMKALGFVRK